MFAVFMNICVYVCMGTHMYMCNNKYNNAAMNLRENKELEDLWKVLEEEKRIDKKYNYIIIQKLKGLFLRILPMKVKPIPSFLIITSG